MSDKAVERLHKNETIPCSIVLADIVALCFLINEETNFTAYFCWYGNCNTATVSVISKNGFERDAVLKMDGCLNISGQSGNAKDFEFCTDTYPQFQQFKDDLMRFYEANRMPTAIPEDAR